MPRGRHIVKEGSLVRFASDIEILAEQVFKKGTRSEKIQMTKMLLPYIYREQPKEVWNAGQNGDPIQEVRVTIVK